MKQITLPNGLTIWSASEQAARFVYHEIFEEQCYKQHGLELREGDTVVNIGANVGLFELWLATQLRRASVHSFEPAPVTFQALRRNLAGSPRLDYHLHNVGLSDRPGRATLSFCPRMPEMSTVRPWSADQQRVYRDHVLAHLRQRSWGLLGRLVPAVLLRRLAERIRRWYMKPVPVEVELTTLSEVVRSCSLLRIDLLKIDTESLECEILAGLDAADWPKVRQAAVEVHSAGDVPRVAGEFDRRGFRVNVADSSGLFMVYAVRGADRDEDAGARAERRHGTAADERGGMARPIERVA
jgi:FkbM family methyltransferase